MTSVLYQLKDFDAQILQMEHCWIRNSKVHDRITFLDLSNNK